MVLEDGEPRGRASPEAGGDPREPTDSEAFRDLFENAPIAYFSADREGWIRRVNRRAGDLLGDEPSRLVGRSVLDLYADTPDGRPKAETLGRWQEEGADLTDEELQIRRADGEIRWVSLTVHVVRDEAGRAVERRGALVDITDRKRAEEALRESEERFHRIFEHSNDAIFMMDPEADRIVEANSKAAEMLEYGHEELLDLPVSAVHPEEMPELMRFARGVFEEGRGWTNELTCLTKSGSHLPAEISASWLEMTGERYLIASVRDVSARRRAEEALRRAHDELEERVRQRTWELREANERLQEEIEQRREAEEAQRRYARRLETLQAIDRAILAAGSPETIARSALGHLQGLVPSARESVALLDEEAGEWLVLAAVGQEVEGLGVGARLPLEAFGDVEELRAGIPRVVADASAGPQPAALAQLMEVAGVRSDLTVPLRSQGELIGTLNLGAHQTEAYGEEEVEVAREVATSLAIGIQHARLQRRLERHAEELERRVAERTAELESFSYSVSHDLRAPLRAVDGFSRILEEEYAESLDAEGRRLLGVVRESTTNMGVLIDDLLAFSRLGRQKLNPAPVDLRELAKEVFAELEGVRSERSVDFRVGDLSPTLGDRTMLRQVLANLLANALKFTRSREPAVIEVGMEEVDGQDAYYVRDNGVGFEMEYAEKAFGVFQRLHTTDEFEGTGVGLATVRRVVERHGGRVWADARPGEGATIYFTLPERG